MEHINIDEDHEARMAIWMAIVEGTRILSGSCSVYISNVSQSALKITPEMTIPSFKTWQLAEALSILSILIKSDTVVTLNIYNLFGKTGPIHFIEDGKDRFMWIQHSITGHTSMLVGRPDIVVTTTPDPPSSLTIERIIECKCQKKVGAPVIRGEFGKAHDLRVTSYLIWSLNTPSKKIIDGARKLGLDIETFGFDDERRSVLISKPENLLFHVANTQEFSKRNNRFAQIVLESSNEIMGKLPTSQST